MTATIATDATIPELTNNGITVIDFMATWCRPCKTMAPIMDELANDLAPAGVKVLKADIENAPRAARMANVRSVPAFAVMKDGNILATRTGACPKAVMKAWVEQTIASTQAQAA